jgi:hypothetical protein
MYITLDYIKATFISYLMKDQGFLHKERASKFWLLYQSLHDSRVVSLCKVCKCVQWSPVSRNRSILHTVDSIEMLNVEDTTFSNHSKSMVCTIIFLTNNLFVSGFSFNTFSTILPRRWLWDALNHFPISLSVKIWDLTWRLYRCFLLSCISIFVICTLQELLN